MIVIKLKTIFSCFLILLFIFSSTPAFAFENSSWINISNFEQQKNTDLTKDTASPYIIKLYRTLSGNDNEDQAAQLGRLKIKSFQDILLARALGLYDISGKSSALTGGFLCETLFKVVDWAYPELNLKSLEAKNESSLAIYFAVSRGLMTQEEISNPSSLTLGAALDIMDRFYKAAPEYKEAFKLTDESVYTMRAYLTFDDNISNNTVTILDTLAKYGVKATFFITGTGKEDILKRIAEEGHSIGNHTLSHNYSKIYSLEEDFWSDFYAEENYLKSVIGYKPILMRFPGGSNNKVSNKYSETEIMQNLTKQSTEKGYIYVDWNVSAQDATTIPATKEEIVSSVIKGAGNKKDIVVLMHQTAVRTTTAEALGEIIENLQAMGYEILPLTAESFHPQFANN